MSNRFLLAGASWVFVLFLATPASGAASAVRQTQISAGIVLFTPAEYDAKKTPSLALLPNLGEQGTPPADWKLTPEFTHESSGAGATLAVPPGSSLYGTGEVTGPLLRNNKTVKLWNTDNFAYGTDNGRRLYQSHPWVLGVRPDGTAFGILFDTTWKAELQTADDRIALRSEGPAFRVAVIDRESPQAVMRGLAELIGTMPLPPRWALGFHQCRYSYFPDARVREIADEFRKRKLPCDVVWLDIHYMNGFRIFTFDPRLFPNPSATNDYLHNKGFHSVWMIDPGVKAERGYPVYDSGTNQKVWVQTKDGKEFHGKVWPGICAFPDFTMPATRQWWSGLYRDFIAKGVDGVWNDMNEPAVFDGPDHTMPEDNQHRGGGDLMPGPHKMYHNVYGLLMTQATREGVQKARPEKRPFVLTRANFLGGQRYAATWTGDNMARMEFLTTSVPMSLNLGLSGQPLSGADIGGYEGNATPELFGKWIALGVFYPFSRAHASVSSHNQEPWAFGPAIENVSRVALERRYRLLPYLYTLAANSSTTGEPMMQPMFFADPKDQDLRSEDRAFLVGSDLMVVPPWADSPKLPKGIWREVSLLEEKREADGYQPKLKLRGGAILPLGRVVQNSNEASLDPLTLLVCLDANGEANGSLYEDAGEGYAYTNGGYALTRFRAKREGDSVLVAVQDRRGSLKLPDRPIEVQLITDSGVVKGRGSEGKGVGVQLVGQ